MIKAYIYAVYYMYYIAFHYKLINDNCKVYFYVKIQKILDIDFMKIRERFLQENVIK